MIPTEAENIKAGFSCDEKIESHEIPTKGQGPAVVPQAPVIPGNHLLSPVRTTIGRKGLASEFGMGSGVSLPVTSPGNLG